MKKIIVTGSAQGIGEEICHHLKKLNYFVIGIDQKASPHANLSITGNLADPLFYAEIKKQVKDDIYAVVNNAAVQVEKKLIETEISEWDNLFHINVRAIFLMTKSLNEQLKGPSSIVNISSVHAKATSEGLAAYASSKGAVSALTRAMAIELGQKIRVNAILPGAIQTPMLEKGLSRNGNAQAAKEKLAQSAPLNKIGAPSDVAKLVHFLIDENLSGNITGQEFVCDGGILSKLASE
jgi:NAD(P)-dependent dehydrogenase (short-subunit alcohol dehydrogenase family)